MAENPSKRHKIQEAGSFDEEASIQIQALVDTILRVDSKVFLDHVLIMGMEKFKMLFARLSQLRLLLEDSLSNFSDLHLIVREDNFSDIPPIDDASTVFPSIVNRTNQSTFSFGNTEIYKAVTFEAADAEAETSLPMQTLVDAILHVHDSQAFLGHVPIIDIKTLFTRLSHLRLLMENSFAKLSDIPPNIIASRVFPFIEHRTDWNNLMLVNTGIYKAVKKNKVIVPPWPELTLDNGCDSEIVLKSPTFSPDGNFISYGEEENICIWSRTNGLVANWRGYGNDNDSDNNEHSDDNDEDNANDDPVLVTSVAFSPDGNLLASVGDYSIIKIWDLANDGGSDYRCLRDWTLDEVYSVAFSPDGKYISTGGSWGRPVCLWRVADGTMFREIRPIRTVCVWVARFSPVGLTIAAGGRANDNSGSVDLWKLDDGAAAARCFSLQGHSSFVYDLAFSPDGKIMASASGDKTIKLWHVITNCCFQTLSGHSNAVNSISFYPDGNFLASGGCDRSVRIWSVTNGNGSCIEAVPVNDTVHKVEFSPDGRMLLKNKGSKSCLWNLDVFMLQKLQEERGALMKQTTKLLKQVLAKKDATFASELSSAATTTKAVIVDHMITKFDRKERTEILSDFFLDGVLVK
jgi:WD40 repeat protein